MNALPRNTILTGDALMRLEELPTASIDCCITSPPYYALRDYGMNAQLGLESSVAGWVESLRTVMAEVGRVLKPTGSLWLNVGDSYSRHTKYGAPQKSLLLGPERLLLDLAADGWIVRNKVVWAKRNSMPQPVTDRLSNTHEVIYFLVRNRSYFFDLDRLRVAQVSRPAKPSRKPPKTRPDGWAGPLAGNQGGLHRMKQHGITGHRLGRNPGDTWSLATSNYRGAHFATFPESLVEKPLLASCPEAICTKCQTPWRRAVDEHQQVGDLIRGCDCGAPTVPAWYSTHFLEQARRVWWQRNMVGTTWASSSTRITSSWRRIASRK